MVSSMLDDDLLRFQWVSWVPLKANCFVWCVLLKRVLVSMNLMVRGVTLSSHTYPFSSNVWKWLYRWLLMQSSPLESLSDVILKMSCNNISKKFIVMKLGHIYSIIWMIRKARNSFVFKKLRGSPMKMA